TVKRSVGQFFRRTCLLNRKKTNQPLPHSFVFRRGGRAIAVQRRQQPVERAKLLPLWLRLQGSRPVSLHREARPIIRRRRACRARRRQLRASQGFGWRLLLANQVAVKLLHQQTCFAIFHAPQTPHHAARSGKKERPRQSFQPFARTFSPIRRV